MGKLFEELRRCYYYTQGPDVSNPEELEPVLDRMRRDWNERAAKDAEQYVYTHDLSTDESDFEASGRVNYEQLVRPFLPVLLCGCSPKRCRVVEIGCGVGRMTRYLAEEFLEIHGVDISAEMIHRARARLRDYPNVFLHVGSGTDLACLPDKYFDLAFSYLVFQHIPSRAVIENYVREAARVLKPGGAFQFQLNGYQARDYRRQEKDTWQGESFSFVEATRMLTQAGFSPLVATGAGTQYFLLAARRIEREVMPLASYILPGKGLAPEQFLEGWGEPAAGDCRPMGPRCRTVLAVPSAPELRLFVSLYFAPIESFPTSTLTVRVDDAILGSASIERTGDYFFEWPLPSHVATQPQALVTLEIHPPERSSVPSIRSLGIYALTEPGHPVEARQRELEERVTWSRELDAQLKQAYHQLEACQQEAERTIARDQECQRLAGRVQELQADLEKTRQVLANLQREFEERTAWAQKLDAEGEAARADLRLLFGSLWYRLGKKLRLGPVPPSDRGRSSRALNAKTPGTGLQGP